MCKTEEVQAQGEPFSLSPLRLPALTILHSLYLFFCITRTVIISAVFYSTFFCYIYVREGLVLPFFCASLQKCCKDVVDLSFNVSKSTILGDGADFLIEGTSEKGLDPVSRSERGKSILLRGQGRKRSHHPTSKHFIFHHRITPPQELVCLVVLLVSPCTALS